MIGKRNHPFPGRSRKDGITILSFLFLLNLTRIAAQQPVPRDSPNVTHIDTTAPVAPKEQLKEIKQKKIENLSDTTGNEPKKSILVDTTRQNKYGDLLNDDDSLNRKYPLWIPVLETVCINGVVWSLDRYVGNYPFSRISRETWRTNMKEGWEWDVDRFGINFIGHPYSGTLSFNAGRSNGYNYIQSSFLSVGGSLMWEYFGENTRPSYNDIINTPVNGAFLGEILYRLSSNILDDRTRGINRAYREVLAGLIDPVRGINRVLQGKAFRHTDREVYQKEPLNFTLSSGIHKINYGERTIFGSGVNSQMVHIQLDYGNPFENRFRKPFDFFKLRTEFDFGAGRKILSNVTGYGILTGTNATHGKHSGLLGLFQYYDYWDNNTFELGTVALGAAAFSKLAIGEKSSAYTNIHIAGVPFAGNSTHFGPDSLTEYRDYNFGYGFEGKFETTWNISHYATASVAYYYYMIKTYVGIPGNNYIGILKPRIIIYLYKGLSIGAEHFIYDNTRKLTDRDPIHSVRTEQKFFIQLFLEDRQRRGRYN